MTIAKPVSLLVLLVLLIGCGHGFEGRYASKAGSTNKLIGSIANSMGAEAEQIVVIGSDYLEADGERVEFDEIFVRESGPQSFLVFRDDEMEEAWKILDEDTLLQNMGIMNIKLVRID